MKALVTGVAGFIGSHLAEKLISEKIDVTGIDSFLDYYPRKFKEKNISVLKGKKNFQIIESCITEADLSKILTDIDIVFHLAAQAGVRSSWGSKFSIYTQNNITATQMLLEAVKKKKIKRFVYASSSSVYGDTSKLPMEEDDSPHPVSPYGVSKLAGEHLSLLYNKSYSVPSVALRFFTVYGPRQRPDMAFHKFLKNITENKPIDVYGDGNQTRDFTFISDIVNATFSAAFSAGSEGKVFNLGGGCRIKLKEVLAIMEKANGSKIKVNFSGEQKGDVKHTYADTSKAKKILNFNPVVSVEEGISREMEWIKSFYGF